MKPKIEPRYVTSAGQDVKTLAEWKEAEVKHLLGEQPTGTSKGRVIYQITVPVESAIGYQFFECEADTEKEAVQMYKSGKATFIAEKLEVRKVGKPKVSQLE